MRSVSYCNVAWVPWRITVGSGFDSGFIGTSLQLQSIITAHNRWLLTTRSIPYWTTSVFSSTVTSHCSHTELIALPSERITTLLWLPGGPNMGLHLTRLLCYSAVSFIAGTRGDPKNLFPRKPWLLITRIHQNLCWIVVDTRTRFREPLSSKWSYSSQYQRKVGE
jgi:hypothetical protein